MNHLYCCHSDSDKATYSIISSIFTINRPAGCTREFRGYNFPKGIVKTLTISGNHQQVNTELLDILLEISLPFEYFIDIGDLRNSTSWEECMYHCLDIYSYVMRLCENRTNLTAQTRSPRNGYCRSFRNSLNWIRSKCHRSYMDDLHHVYVILKCLLLAVNELFENPSILRTMEHQGDKVELSDVFNESVITALETCFQMNTLVGYVCLLYYLEYLAYVTLKVIHRVINNITPVNEYSYLRLEQMCAIYLNIFKELLSRLRMLTTQINENFAMQAFKRLIHFACCISRRKFINNGLTDELRECLTSLFQCGDISVYMSSPSWHLADFVLMVDQIYWEEREHLMATILLNLLPLTEQFHNLFQLAHEHIRLRNTYAIQLQWIEATQMKVITLRHQSISRIVSSLRGNLISGLDVLCLPHSLKDYILSFQF